MVCFLFILLLSLADNQGAFAQVTLNFNYSRQCLSGNDLKQQLSPQVMEKVKNIPFCPCGGAGNWRKIIDINLEDSSQVCPSNWTLVSTSNFRGCGRSTRTRASTDSAFFPSGGVPYSRVCGRINAIQYGTPDAFYPSTHPVWTQYQNIESAYLAGVSLTYGVPGSRKHIWSFADAYNNQNSISTCSCTSSENWPYQVYAFVNNNYFCETGSHTASPPEDYLYNNILWDGTGCHQDSTCCSFNAPPWFCTRLPESTTENLELRICLLDAAGEDVVVTRAEIYVQ